MPTRVAAELDGSFSYDPDRRALAFMWTVTAAPSGSSATLVGATTANPTFKPDRDGTYVLTLVVGAGTDQASDTMTLTAQNLAPQVSAGDDVATYTGSDLELSGSASDENGDSLSYGWTIANRPTGSVAALTGDGSLTPHLVPDIDGVYVLRVVASDGTAQSAPATVTVTSYHPIARLPHRVIDAEISRQLARIVTVGENPNSLYVFDPDTGTETTVALPLPPTSVSVSPDGSHAAVGHDANVSYVNLVDGQLVRTYPVTIQVLDVILAGNGYIYAFPLRDQWTAIHSLELATGAETMSSFPSIYAGTVAKLHPDGDRMYGANNGLSPSDIENYDISAGTAQVVRDSPYHGDYAMCGDLWITEEGARIVTRCGNTFRATQSASTDMTYSGSLPGITTLIEHADHTTNAGKIMVIPGNGYLDPESLDVNVRIYDDEFLRFDGQRPLSSFILEGQAFQGHGRFVFIDPDGAHFHVILEADPTSGLLNDYAIASYPL